MLYLLIDCACHELDAASALVFLRDAHSVDLHVIRDPQDVCDWRSVAELYAGHSTVPDYGCVQGVLILKSRLKINQGYKQTSHPQTQAEK